MNVTNLLGFWGLVVAETSFFGLKGLLAGNVECSIILDVEVDLLHVPDHHHVDEYHTLSVAKFGCSVLDVLDKMLIRQVELFISSFSENLELSSHGLIKVNV